MGKNKIEINESKLVFSACMQEHKFWEVVDGVLVCERKKKRETEGEREEG